MKGAGVIARLYFFRHAYLRAASCSFGAVITLNVAPSRQ